MGCTQNKIKIFNVIYYTIREMIKSRETQLWEQKILIHYNTEDIARHIGKQANID